MNSVLKNTKIIKCKWQPKNLKQVLTSSEFTIKEAKVLKCNKPRCGLCPYLMAGNSFDFNERRFKIKISMSCDVSNVIYVLICNGCKKYYIGQTGDKLRNRRTVHEQQVIYIYIYMHFDSFLLLMYNMSKIGNKFRPPVRIFPKIWMRI